MKPRLRLRFPGGSFDAEGLVAIIALVLIVIYLWR